MPAGGIIKATVGDTIQIDLASTDPKQDSKMTPDTVTAFDESLQKRISTVIFLEPDTLPATKQAIHYTFVARDATAEWLHIVYNHDTVLRYRLMIKPRDMVPDQTRFISPVNSASP